MIETIMSMYNLDYLDNSTQAQKKDLVIGTIVLFLFGTMVFGINQLFVTELAAKSYYNYLAAFVCSSSMAFIPRIWISYSNKKFIRLKKAISYLLTTLALIVAIPIIASMYVLNRTGFITVTKHYIIFIIGITLSLVIALTIFFSLPAFINNYIFLNQMGLIIFLSFIAFRVAMQCVYKGYFLYKRLRLNRRKKRNPELTEQIDEDILQLIKDEEFMYKEFAILVYIAIAFITALFYFINLDSIFYDENTYESFKEGTMIAITLYTAIEAILDKRKDRLESF